MILSDLIPNPSTRAWLRKVWSRSPEWATELTLALYEGVLLDMGYLEPIVEPETIKELDLPNPAQLDLLAQGQLDLYGGDGRGRDGR